MRTNLRSKCSRSRQTDAWKDAAEKHTGILYTNQYVHEVAREYRGSAGADILYIPVNINVVAVTGGGRV